MTGGAWAALILCSPLALLLLAMPIAAWRGQRRCDRLNAANAAARETWRALTPDDRAWLLANGATRPSTVEWVMR